MGFFKDIADLMVKDDSLRDLDRSQCEAIIDAMVFLAYADGEETVLERAELDHLLHELPWALHEGHAAEDYKAERAAAIKASIDAGEFNARDVANSIAERLEGTDLRKKALKMAAAVAYANWDAGEHEDAALMLLADAFDIPAPFARAMILDTEDAATFWEGELEEDTDAEHIPAPAQNTIRDVLSQDFLQGFFTDLFDGDELRHLDEEASYAFVDALSLALVSDGYPEEEELREFKSQLESLPFASDDAEHVKARVEIVIETLRQLDGDGRVAYMRDVAAKIPSDSFKDRALQMAVMITNADLEITKEETSMLMQLADAFDISSERVEELISSAGVRNEDDFLG